MLGIMDWGIGGLSVYIALRNKGYTGDVLYFSDSGFTPYGKTERTQLRERLGEVAKIFADQGVSQVLIACNAASSALNSDSETMKGVGFTGIISSGVRAVDASEKERIGVIGGNLTIKSGIYQQRLKPLSRTFTFQPAQALSAYVEAGILSGDELESELRQILNALGEIDALLLACTHYPALAPAIKKLAPNVELLDPALFTSDEMLNEERGMGRLSFLTSGSLKDSKNAAKLAWNLRI